MADDFTVNLADKLKRRGVIGPEPFHNLHFFIAAEGVADNRDDVRAIIFFRLAHAQGAVRRGVMMMSVMRLHHACASPSGVKG
ncbi:MAG: hypothetical protein R3C60_02585 [Parvularculaceae bacterium]